MVEPVYFYAIDEQRKALVLTPTCDFEHGKAELVQACAVFPAVDLLRELLRGDWVKLGLVDAGGGLVAGPLSVGKTNDLSSNIKNLIGQKIPRFHWLAPLPDTSTPLVADFQILTSVAIEDLADSVILASLASPFREQCAARYAAYMGRVGTPDFPKEEVEQWVGACLKDLFP